MGWSWNTPCDRHLVITGKEPPMYDAVFHFPPSDFSVFDVPLLEEMLSDSLRVWNEINNQTVLGCCDNDANNQKMGSKKLSLETISEYFYTPITQAARELNVGLTLLKKRCRELGIPRWPRRKLASIKTLENNLQDLGDEEGAVIQRRELEKKRRLLEENPGIPLDASTKRLRQAYFKASYKKRRLMGAVGSSIQSTSKRRATDNGTAVVNGDRGNVGDGGGGEEEEYLKYLSF